MSRIPALRKRLIPAVVLAVILAAGPVKVTTVSRDGRTELDQGQLTLVDNEIDQNTGTARLKATFGNAHNTLWPGQYVNARVLVRVARNALTLPTPAVQAFVDRILQPPMIFDADQLTTLLASLDLGWKARTQKELALMDELVPLLKKRAGDREIAGLKAYEE